MNAIKIGSTFLDLSPDANIRIDSITSMFQTEVFQGSYSFPFELKWTPANMNALGFPTVIEVIGREKKWNAELYWKQTKRAACKLVLQKATRRSITVNLVVGIASLSVFEKKLSEINLGGDRYLGYRQEDIIGFADSLTGLNYPATAFNFPSISWPNFYGNNNPDFAGVANRYDINNQTYQPNIRSTSSPINTNTLVPVVFSAYIIRQAFLEEGFQVAGDVFQDPEILQHQTCHNNSIDDVRGQYYLRADVTTPFTVNHGVDNRVYFNNDVDLPSVDTYEIYDASNCFFVIEAEATYEIAVTVQLDIPAPAQYGVAAINLYRDGAVPVASATFTVNTGGVQSFTHVFTFTAVTADVGSTFYAETGYSDSFLGYLNVNCEGGTLSVRSSLYPTDQLHTESDFNRFKTTINLQQHVPDVTFGEFFEALRGTFNISASLDISTAQVNLNLINNSISQQPDADYSAKVTRDYSIEYDADPKGYTFGWLFPGADSDENFKAFNFDQLVASVLNFATLPPAVGNEDKFAIVLNQNRVFQSKFDTALSIQVWQYYTDYYYDFTITPAGLIAAAADAIDARAKASPLLMTNKSNVGGQCLMPHTLTAGKSTAFDTGSVDSKDIRFVFWRGLQPGASGNLYPCSGTTRYNFTGAIVGTYQLHFQQSLFFTFWQKWVNILMRGEFIRRFIRLDIADLLAMSELPKRIGFRNYFFTKVSTVWGKKIDESEVEMRGI
jgi:hypothetical protein